MTKSNWAEQGERNTGVRRRTTEEEREKGDKSTQRQQTEKREKKELCDNITATDMNMTMNCAARFKSNSVVLSLMFTSQSQQGVEATLAVSIISHTPVAVTQNCNSYQNTAEWNRERLGSS